MKAPTVTANTEIPDTAAASAFPPTAYRFFPNVPYQLIGFAYNSQREFCAVLIQPYIKAEREATEEEIASYMRLLGFEMDYYDEYHNENYKIFDDVPNNVLYGIDGNLYFIDTQIRIKRCIRMQY